MLHIKKNHQSVTICLKEDATYFDGFIDIWVDDEETPSPFKDVETAELFATMIVKLLEAVHDFNEVGK